MGEVKTPDFGFESKVKNAIFGVYWNSGEPFYIYVLADGRNTLPTFIKRKDWSNVGGYVPLILGQNLPRRAALSHDELGIFVMGLSFDGSLFDVSIPWSEVAGVIRPKGPGFTFSTRVEVMPEARAPVTEGSNVVNLAERRRPKA